MLPVNPRMYLVAARILTSVPPVLRMKLTWTVFGRVQPLEKILGFVTTRDQENTFEKENFSCPEQNCDFHSKTS